MLRLRPPGDGDAHRIAEICADPEIARWTHVPSPYTLEDAHSWIALAAIERERGTGLHLLAERIADGRIAGSAALRVHRHPRRRGEIGYWVAPDARRAGVGTRAVTLLTRFALEDLGLLYMEIVISPDNTASLALARRAGFCEDGGQLREFKGELAEFTLWRRDA